MKVADLKKINVKTKDITDLMNNSTLKRMITFLTNFVKL